MKSELLSIRKSGLIYDASAAIRPVSWCGSSRGIIQLLVCMIGLVCHITTHAEHALRSPGDGEFEHRREAPI